MFDRFSPSAIIGAGAWLLFFVGWTIRIRKRWFDRSAQGETAGPYPEPLLQGMILLALGPAISVIHYLASRGEAFWGGGVIALTGLALIAAHRRLKRRPRGEESYQQTTFREKSVLAQFASVLVVFGLYGVKLWGQPLSPGSTIRVLMAVAVLLIIINVIAHIAIRVNTSSPERPDERDLTVARRGARNAYYVLGFGVWAVLVFAAAPAFQPHLFYVLLGALAVAELVRLGSQLLYYRIGT